MQTDEDPELAIGVDADGYRVDHRSETEQSSQSKEVHEYPDRTEIRLRDDKEIRLEEVKTRETTRPATYDEIIALLDAQMDGLDEVQASREVTIQEFNRAETTRETVTDGELKREIRITDEKRKEEILEGPSNSQREVTMEIETTVVPPSPGALPLEETESPLSQFSDDTEPPSDQPFMDPGLGAQPVRGGFTVGITPGDAEFRIRSEGVGGKIPVKTEREVVWIPKQTAEEKGKLSVPGELNLAESTGSLHRIQHRAHRLEELIVEDVDTFYEDQSKPVKRLSGLLGVKKEKRGKSQSPPSTLERPTVNEENLVIEMENITPKPSPERSTQPAGVGITAVPRTDIVIQPNVSDSGVTDKPRDVIADPQDGNTNRVTYVVTYDYPAGVKIRDPGKRKKDVHPKKKKKDKRRLGKQQPETEHEMPAETEFVTYVVNYDRSQPLDGDNTPPRPTIITKSEGSFPEPSIPKDPRSAENMTIEVDMNAGDVKVMEPVRVTEEIQGESKTFVVDYEIPAVEKPAKPGKPRKVFKEVTIPDSGKRQSPNEETTYIVNYDMPSVTPVVPTTLVKTPVESADVTLDLEKKAPVYSITVVDPGQEVSAERTKQSPEKTSKKRDRENKDAFELTYIVNYDEPRETGSPGDASEMPRKEGGRDVWVRPSKPAFETKVKGKDEIKAQVKDAPENSESLTYVVEYEIGAEEKAKGGIPVPKLKKGSSSNDAVETMYTYIVNYDQPSGRPKKEKKKKGGKKGKVVKATVKPEEPHLKKSYEIEQPSPELSIMVKHPSPEPITEPQKPSSEPSITVQQPIPEPTFEVREPIQELSITVDHPFPEPVAKPEELFEEYSVTVDHPFPEPIAIPRQPSQEFSLTVDHPFPEPVAKPEEQFEEYSVTVDNPFPEPVKQPEQQFEEYSITVDHPFPEPIEIPQQPSQELSITVDHPIPEANLEIEEPVLPQPKLPEPIPSKDSGETSTYVVTYEEPTVPGKDKRIKVKKKRKPWLYKGSKPSAKAKVKTETSQDNEQTFTYIVNYDEPSIRLKHPGVPKPIEIETQLSGKADVKAPKLEIETSAKTSEPKETVGQSETLSITVTQPIPEIRRAEADIALSESPESMTYIVHYDEPSSVGLTGEKHKKIPKKEAELKTKKPTEIESGSFTVVHDQPELPEATSAITTDISLKPESPKEMTFIVHYDLPSKTEQNVDVPEIEVEPPATIEIQPPTANVSADLRVIQLPSIPSINAEESQTDISVKVEEPDITVPPLVIPAPTGESITYVVHHEATRAKATGKQKPEKGKAKNKGWTFPKKKPPAGADIEVEGGPVSTTTYEASVTTDQPKPAVSVEAPTIRPKVSAATTAPTITIPKIDKNITTETVTFVVTYDQPENVIPIPEVKDTMAIEVEADGVPQIEPFEIPEPDVEVEEPSSKLAITVEEPLPKASAEVELLTPEISMKVNEPVAPIVATPDIALSKGATAETITYIVTHEEPTLKISGEVKPDKKEKKKRKKVSKDMKASVSVEAKAPEVTTEIAGGVPVYEVAVTTEQQEPTVDIKKMPEVSVTTPEAAIAITKPSTDIDLPAQTQPQSITYVVTYDDSETIPKSKIKDTAISKGKKIDTPKVKTPKAQEGEKPLLREGESITYVVTYDDSGKIVPPPKIKESAALEFEVKDIPRIKSPEIPQTEVDIAEPSSQLTITVQQPLPEISAEVKPPAPEIKIKEPPEVEQLTITVEETLPKVSSEVKPPTPEITVTKPPKADITLPSVEVGQGGTFESITYIVTHDESTLKSSDDAKPEKKEKKRRGFSFPGKKMAKELKVEGEVEAKGPKAAMETASGVPIYEVTVITEQQKPQVHIEEENPEVAIETAKPIIEAPREEKAQTEDESFTYIVKYDDSGKLSPPEVKEPALIEGQVQDIPHIKSPEIPETEVKVAEPSSQFAITVEHPLPDISAEVKAPTPEIRVKEPSEVVVKPPSVKPPKVGTTETITYIVTHEEAALKVSGEVQPEKKGKKKGGFVFPRKKVSKNLKVGEGVEATRPEATAEVARGVPLYEVTVTTEQIEPSVDVKKKKKSDVSLRTPEAVVSIAKPFADIAAQAHPETQSITYIVTSDDTGMVIQPPAKIEPVAVELETKGIPDITYPEIPEAQLEMETPSPQLTITAEQPQIKAPTPDIKIKEPSEIEQPLPEVSSEIKTPTPKISIREPSEVEQLTITVEHPLPEVSTKGKLPTPEIKVKEPSKFVVKPPSVELSKQGAPEAITYIVTHEDPTLKISGVAQPEEKEKKKKRFRFPGKYFGKNFKADAKAELKEPKVSKVIKEEIPLPEISVTKEQPMPKVHIKEKKPAIDIATEEVVTYVVTYDDSAKVVPATEIKSPGISEAEFKVEEPSPQLTITAEQPLPEISKEFKLPTPEISVKEPPEEEQITITVEQPLPEISKEFKLPTPEISVKEPPEGEQLTITVEQPILEVSTKVKPPTPKMKVKEPSETVVKPPTVELPKAGTAETITYIVTHEEAALKVSGEVKPEKKEKKQLGIRLPGKRVAKELKAGATIEAKGPTAEVTGEVPVYEVTATTEQPALPVKPEAADISATTGDIVLRDAVETVTYVVEHEKEPHAKEAISAEGQKKRKDWIWRVKKPAKSIEVSSAESPDKEAGRLEPEAGISAEIVEPNVVISAKAETPGQEISISTEKPKVTQEIPQLTGLPETHTYIVTYDEPYMTSSKRKLKLWPFSRKAPSGKIEAEHKPKEKKWALFKKKEPKVVKPRVDIQLAEINPTDLVSGETIRGDIDLSLPAAPSIAVEQQETTKGTEVIPVAPEYSVTVSREEPSAEQVTVPHPELKTTEAEGTGLDIQAQKPTDVSEMKFDVEAKLPDWKEQAFAEKIISGKLKLADAEAERTELEDKNRSVITGGIREYENAAEETVIYIVNYKQPFGTLTKTKDGARDASAFKPSAEAEVAVETEKPAVTNIENSVQVQLPQLEQCILVPIRDESSPEDSFYGTEAPVSAWPPVDEPHFEEVAGPEFLEQKFETKWPNAIDEKQLPPHLVVVAIDFGTTFSGYAFSFSHDSTGSIHVMRKWEGGDPGAVDHKTPTILLLTPGGQFHSFGFTARDFYHDLSPKEATRWLYFEKFKMALHFNADLNTDTKLAAANGQYVPAIDVFTHALRFFRRHVLQEVSDQVSTEVLNEDIYWIITVPAIWTEEAKQFMRLAAYRAGIASPNYPDQLLISLEPEAASIYVRKQRLHQLVPEVPFQRRRSYRRSMTPEPTAVNQPISASDRKVLPTDSGQVVKTTTTVSVSWPVVTTIPQTDITVGHQVDTAGSRYMVVDCGGGTVDITVHEIQSRDGTLREVHRATGGPFGSVAVDQEYEKLLVEIFGADFIDVFKVKRPAGWVDLLMAFESRKRAASPYHTKPLNVSLPFSFIDYHKKYRNCPVEHAIRKYGNRDIRWSSQGMLRLMPDAMNRLFHPAIEKIKEAIGNVLNNSEVKGLRFLFLVGGFADSPMLQVAIRQEFGHLLRVMIPNDASISILKGAVCFGVDPTVISTRKSRMTYGVGVLNRFVHGQHPPSKLILKDGEEWCTDVFDALVYADQSVAIGDTVLRRYTLVPGDSDNVSVSKSVNIYSADRRDVKFVTDRGVTRCGTLSLTDEERKKPSASRQDPKDREVQVRMTFGHTEIKVTAFDLSTRKSVRATIDFLNK